MEYITTIISIIGTVVTLIVLLLTKKDIKTLKSHQITLKEHEEKLKSVRPLYSTLITDEAEIMELAVSSTAESKELYSLGTISSLKDVERLNSEDEKTFNERTKDVKPSTKLYVKAISDSILKGNEYCRIINILSIDKKEDFDVVLANIKFFCRLMEFNSQTDIKLKLYHNSEILSDSGNYHFRCSDKKVIIRIGGHGNKKSNAAIVITDTKVIDEFKNYYFSLIESPKTKQLDYSSLLKIKSFLESNDIKSIKTILAE